MPELISARLTVLTRVVNTGLDDVIHGEAAGGGLSPQLAVDLLGQHLQPMEVGKYGTARAVTVVCG